MANNYLTPPCRLAFENLSRTKKPMKGRTQQGDPKFGCTLLFAPAALTSPAMLNLYKAYIETAKERFPRIPTAGAKPFEGLPGIKNPFRKGEEKTGVYAGFEPGMIFLNVTSIYKPTLFNRNREEIVDPSEVYSGCYGRALLTCFAYDNEGKGVAFGVNGFQKLSDGEKLGGGGGARADDFTPLDDEAGAENLSELWA